MPIHNFIDTIVTSVSLYTKSTYSYVSNITNKSSVFLTYPKLLYSTPTLSVNTLSSKHFSNANLLVLSSDFNLNYQNKLPLNRTSLHVKETTYNFLNAFIYNNSQAILQCSQTFENSTYNLQTVSIKKSFSETVIYISSTEDSQDLVWNTNLNKVYDQQINFTDPDDGSGGNGNNQASSLKEFWA